MLYRLGAASIDIPDHWEDKTIIAFSAPAQGPGDVPPNVVFNRDALATLPDGRFEDFDAYVERQIVSLTEKVPQFSLLPPDFITQKQECEREVSFVWRTAEAALRQAMIVSCHHPPRILTMTFTCAAKDFQGFKDEFERIRRSIDLSEVG